MISDKAWVYDGRPGREIRTPHYIVRTTETSPALVDRLPAFLEASLANYRAALAPPGRPLPEPAGEPMETYVFDSRAPWERLTRQLLGASAPAYLEIGQGGYAFAGRGVLFDIGASGTLAVAAHEGWHQYTQRTFAQPLPFWLEEGVGVYMEGHRYSGSRDGLPRFMPWANPERFDQLRAAHASGRLLSLGELLDADPSRLIARSDDAALTYYAQVWALTLFLAEGQGGQSRAALESLISDAAEGRLGERISTQLGPRAARASLRARRGPPAFLAYFGDPSRFEGAFAAFIGEVVAVGSRGAIVEGRSPLTTKSSPASVSPGPRHVSPHSRLPHALWGPRSIAAAQGRQESP